MLQNEYFGPKTGSDTAENEPQCANFLKQIWQHLANLAAELVLGLEPHKLRLERRALHCFLNFGGVVAEGTTTTLRNLTLSHPLDYEIA